MAATRTYNLLPDGDISVPEEWTVAPLWSKIDETSAQPDSVTMADHIVGTINTSGIGIPEQYTASTRLSLSDASVDTRVGQTIRVGVLGYSQLSTGNTGMDYGSGWAGVMLGNSSLTSVTIDSTTLMWYYSPTTAVSLTQADLNSLQLQLDTSIYTGETSGGGTHQFYVYAAFVTFTANKYQGTRMII